MFHRRRYLIIELLAVFVLLPWLMSEFYSRVLMLGALWGGMFVMLAVLMKNPHFSAPAEWNWKAVNRVNLRAMMLRFVPFAVALTIFTWCVLPDKFLSLPRERPWMWLILMTLYPLLSVVPQELMYRSYFFHRYRRLFPTPFLLMLASALVFGYVHILLRNWFAVLTCMAAGILFAHTYQKHRSLALVSLEHALYGCFVFTLGLGWFFYSGNRMLH